MITELVELVDELDCIVDKFKQKIKCLRRDIKRLRKPTGFIIRFNRFFNEDKDVAISNFPNEKRDDQLIFQFSKELDQIPAFHYTIIFSNITENMYSIWVYSTCSSNRDELIRYLQRKYDKLGIAGFFEVL